MTKREASQANAQRSTGPRSAAGKSRSARNAVSHGLQSSDVVLAHENAGEFDHILNHYQAQVDLSDPEQCFLAGQIAQAQWRLRRAQRLTRLYLDLEITGFSADPSPDEIIVRNMEQRGNDVPATLQRHETHFQRLWWRINRKLEALRERDETEWEFDVEERLRQDELAFSALKARAAAEHHARQQQKEQGDAPLTPEEAVDAMTLEKCRIVVETIAQIESGQTNPPAEQTKEEAFLLSLNPALRSRFCQAAKARVAQTKPTALAA